MKLTNEGVMLGKKRRSVVNERYRLKHRKEIAAYRETWYAENREQNRTAVRRYQQKLKRFLIAHYSSNTNKCGRCGIDDIDVLSIDHINGNGNKHRQAIGVTSGYNFYRWLKNEGLPSGFQVLCLNCNIKKHIEEGVKCG